MGVNRAVGYGVLTRVWGVLAGPVSMLLIATRFSGAEQGYYYTFSSLLALQIFFELGLLTVMAQFASHEFAQLSWGTRGEILGVASHRERLLDLLYKGCKWYSVSALLLVLALVPAGWHFFAAAGSAGSAGSTGTFSWRVPWLLGVLGVAGNLLLIPFYAVVTGSGDVATVNQREMLGGLVGSLTSWLVIGLGGGLYAVPSVSAGTIVIGVAYLWRRKPELVKSVWRHRLSRDTVLHPVSWRGEVWPMQWKIALSWVSGYFIFQLFTPVLFHYQGAVVAGQMGMTLSASNALIGVCLTWMGAASPEFGRLIALRQWQGLDTLFRRVMLQSGTIALAGATLGTGAVWFLQGHFQLGQRFLPVGQCALLFFSVLVAVISNGFAAYLRAHKQEPLLYVSLAAGVIQGTATWLLGKHYSSGGVTLGYFAVGLCFSLPAVYLVWRRCRCQWHPETV